MSKHSLRHTLILCLLLPLLCSCQDRDIIPVNRMVDILFDIYRFDATASNVDYFMDNDTRARYYNGIFAKHGTDKEAFDRSLKWYADHPDNWRLVYEQLGKKSEQYVELVQNGELPELKKRGIAQQTLDTFNYWISKNRMYWYSDDNLPMDFSRLRQTLDGRKYFIGARRVELTFRMRCNAADSLSTEASMIIRYVRNDKSDTLRVSAKADNRWHKYLIYSANPGKSIASITLTLADSTSASKLSSLEYEDVRFSYIYSKTDKHVDSNDKRQFSRDKMYNTNRQERFNVKRGQDGETNSSKTDNFIEFAVSRR